MTERFDNGRDTTKHSRGAGYGTYDKFTVVGLATGITSDDQRFFAEHPEQSERWRPFIDGEAEASDATDVYLYEDRFFDGTRTGVRHRMLLHRVERPWDDDEPPAAPVGVRS